MAPPAASASASAGMRSAVLSTGIVLLWLLGNCSTNYEQIIERQRVEIDDLTRLLAKYERADGETQRIDASTDGCGAAVHAQSTT